MSFLARDGYGPVEYTRAPSGVFTEWGGRPGISTRAVKSTSTPLPSPMAMLGLVTIDNWQRNLIVRRPENLSGYEKLAWRRGHELLVQAEQSGWPSTGAPFVYAHGAGQTDIAYAVPGDNLTLKFHFPAGKDAYRELVSKPGLTAFVTVDRSTGFFMSCRFRHG